MNTRLNKLIIIPALMAGFLNAVNVRADMAIDKGTLNYENRAYVHAIHNAPNPVTDKTVASAKIVYADKAYGQAIYSYPSNVAFQETDFNVEYVDTANGQAIYSYPSNNLIKPRLELSAKTQHLSNKFIVPVVTNKTDATSVTAMP